jgi:hypothetical protein
MKLLINNAFSLVVLLAALSLSACQSNPHNNQLPSANAASLTEKQKEYDQLLAEWKTLKPGLQRLLSIEEELKLLIGQLDQLSANLQQNQAAPVLAINAHNGPAPVPVAATPSSTHYIAAPVVQAAPAVIPSALLATETASVTDTSNQYSVQSDANYALQVASITELRGLPKVWNQMLQKNSTLLANLEPNYQKTNVKNTDYYRLKVGGFSTHGEANQKCSALKAAGVACLVVSYTSSNFAQLAN